MDRVTTVKKAKRMRYDWQEGLVHASHCVWRQQFEEQLPSRFVEQWEACGEPFGANDE